MLKARKRRARRALERQLEYQQRKLERIAGREEAVMEGMREHSRAVRLLLEEVQALPARARVLEIGSGAHGLIFFFDAPERVGVDPLADHYRRMFPWQNRAHTIAAGGERLPFAESSFDIVLCDNVVDHAEGPKQIVSEAARVLVPGGLLYFTVNVHHPFYGLASRVYGAWRAAGVPLEVQPFADHTVHLTLDGARQLFHGSAFRILREGHNIAAVKANRQSPRHLGDRLKRLFFKNARYDVIAIKTPSKAFSAATKGDRQVAAR